ncbi:hypothetical protein CARUB_v10027249mg [Capsella rubella]|uniref:RIN4 pathogenic type III effector avirulence factor Avr cleavage site domain-containing protein n=1 Tax=Capsella rubella TaxID=81985 RepID=R0GSG1_9BRAS|nr:uncharacterized protein LOC17874891 [Capsella rubella]EOA14108.1 hypothetical protein CARUB_v10027249mg [Capsella rubella]
MDYEYGGGEYCKRGHVPAFGSWDWNDAVPFTQCFETATTTTTTATQQPPPQAFLHYAPYSHHQDRDLYLAGDLYDNHHLVAPAVILLPRRRAKVGQEPAEKKRNVSKEQHNYKTEAREANAPVNVKRRMKTPKPVDEDLYKVSPQLLSVKSKRKRGFGCISRCFLPTRVL